MSDKPNTPERSDSYLRESLKFSQDNKFYKAVYAMRKNRHTIGMACAVNFGQDPQVSTDVRLVTWNGCTGDQCQRKVQTVRYSNKRFGKYKFYTQNTKTSGDFSFLMVTRNNYDKKWFKFLCPKYLKERDQKKDFKVYTIHEGKLECFQLNYKQDGDMYDLDIPDDLCDLKLNGSPVIEEEQYFVGVLQHVQEKESDQDRFIPFFLKEQVFACVPITIDCVEIKGPATQGGGTGMEGNSHESQPSLTDPLNEQQTDAVGKTVTSRNFPSTQDVMNSIAMKFLQPVDASDQGQVDRFFQNLEKANKILVVDVKKKCLMITVECTTLQILDNLWNNYCRGYLDELAQNFLVTEDILKSFGLIEVKLKTTIPEEDYRACQEYFLKLSDLKEEDASTSPASQTEQETLSDSNKEEDAYTSPASPTEQETHAAGGEEHLPRRESLAGICRRLSDLPRPVREFVGRNQEINDIKKYVIPGPENDCRCVLVHGATGMGKTATAIKAANEIRDDDDNTAVVYINCNYVSSLDDLAGKISKQVYHFPLNEPIEEVKRRLINEQDLFTILLLDNFQFLLPSSASRQADVQPELKRVESIERSKITTFITEIVRASAKVKLLVTSSDIVAFPELGRQRIRLHPLEKDDSFNLLKIVYGNSVRLEKEIAYKIAEFCNGIPLALISLASWHDHPFDLVQMMTNANSKQRFKKFIGIPIAEESKKIDVCLDACFDRLNQHLQDTLISLSLFRGHFTMETAVEVFPPKTELERHILELAQRSFLEQNELGPTAPCWYSLLTVQKLYCQHKALEGRFRKVYDDARELFIEHFLGFLGDTFKDFLSTEALQAIAAFRQEEESIMQLLDWFKSGAMDEEQILRCVDVFNEVGELLAKMMGKERFEVVFNLLMDKCKNMGDKKRLSECLTSLGIKEVFDCFFALRLSDGAAERAKQHLVEAERIQTELQISTGNSRAQCLAKLGRCLAIEGQFRDGKEKIQQAIEIRREHGEEDCVMLGATYNDFAVALSLEAAHQPQETAHELLREAVAVRQTQTLPIYRKKLGEHPFTATILNSLSRNYRTLGNFENAKQYSEEALKIWSDFLRDHMETALSLFDLAMVLKEKEELEAAKTNLEKCEAMQKKVLDESNMDLHRTQQELEEVRNRLADLQL